VPLLRLSGYTHKNLEEIAVGRQEIWTNQTSRNRGKIEVRSMQDYFFGLLFGQSDVRRFRFRLTKTTAKIVSKTDPDHRIR
jgi:hypothetical protein